MNDDMDLYDILDDFPEHDPDSESIARMHRIQAFDEAAKCIIKWALITAFFCIIAMLFAWVITQ